MQQFHTFDTNNYEISEEANHVPAVNVRAFGKSYPGVCHAGSE